MSEKIKPVLNGAAETMLQSFYARAMYSKDPKHKFHDAKAEEIVAKLDYDFSNAQNDAAMSGGVVARTIVFDEPGRRLYSEKSRLHGRKHRLRTGYALLPYG